MLRARGLIYVPEYATLVFAARCIYRRAKFEVEEWVRPASSPLSLLHILCCVAFSCRNIEFQTPNFQSPNSGYHYHCPTPNLSPYSSFAHSPFKTPPRISSPFMTLPSSAYRLPKSTKHPSTNAVNLLIAMRSFVVAGKRRSSHGPTIPARNAWSSWSWTPMSSRRIWRACWKLWISIWCLEASEESCARVREEALTSSLIISILCPLSAWGEPTSVVSESLTSLAMAFDMLPISCSCLNIVSKSWVNCRLRWINTAFFRKVRPTNSRNPAIIAISIFLYSLLNRLFPSMILSFLANRWARFALKLAINLSCLLREREALWMRCKRMVDCSAVRTISSCVRDVIESFDDMEENFESQTEVERWCFVFLAFCTTVGVNDKVSAFPFALVAGLRSCFWCFQNGLILAVILTLAWRFSCLALRGLGLNETALRVEALRLCFVSWRVVWGLKSLKTMVAISSLVLDFLTLISSSSDGENSSLESWGAVANSCENRRVRFPPILSPLDPRTSSPSSESDSFSVTNSETCENCRDRFLSISTLFSIFSMFFFDLANLRSREIRLVAMICFLFPLKIGKGTEIVWNVR